MPAASPSSPRFRRPFLERRAGYITAALVMPLALLAAILLRLPPPEEEHEEPLPMKVLVEFDPEPPPPTPPEPEPVPTPPQEFIPPEAVATRKDSNEEGEEILDPVPAEEDPVEFALDDPVPDPLVQEPVPLEEWVPSTDEAAELEVLAAELGRKQASLAARQDVIQERIVRAQVDSAAREFELDSDGGTEGAIRLLDVDGFPERVVLETLGRYGITYERKWTSPSAGRNFLNAATTEHGTYRNVDAEGFYDVMSLSAKAVAWMASAEIEALQDKGFNPRTSRVRKIVFGIVMRDEGVYELGVTDLAVERIR